MKNTKIKNKKGRIIVVQGGSYGSESKGLVCTELCRLEKIDISVRTGSINAGHTCYYKGKAYKNQQIPVAWVSPKVKLVIGAGAYVSPEVLEREIKMIEKLIGKSLKGRLFIDKRCGAHLPIHAKRETGMHERMGSTGEGCSEAIKDKMSRKYDYIMFKDTPFAKKNDNKHFQIVDTVKMLHDCYDKGGVILLEGTQGTMLDLHLSHFPYCTSRQTTASAWLTEAGLSPAMNVEVVLVCRTFPIRVAGNSGPMPGEIEWQHLAEYVNESRKNKRLGLPELISVPSLRNFEDKLASVKESWNMPKKPLCEYTNDERIKYSTELVTLHKQVFENLPIEDQNELKKLFEMTTVTKKLRRIAMLDIEELKYAIRINRPKYLVMNFMNYAFPSLYELKPNQSWKDSLESREIRNFINYLKAKTGVFVKYINWCPQKIETTIPWEN